MRRLNVLYLPHPEAATDSAWGEDVMAALVTSHDVKRFNTTRPAAPQFENVEVIIDIGGNIQDDLIGVATSAGVKFIQVQTNGLDHVKVHEILESGMMLAHCPGLLSSVALAESAMMFLLLLAKRYREAVANFAQKTMYLPMGRDLAGSTLGIVGFGAAGQALAHRAKGFGMRLVANDIHSIEPRILDDIQPDFMGGGGDLDRVIQESDYLSLHLHLTPETRHIIDAGRIACMKPTASLINVSRGALVDEDALYQALIEGRIGGAGLDAFAKEPPETNHPVYQLPNVCVTPHTAGGTNGTSRRRAAFAAANLDRYARGEPPEEQVR